MLRTEVAHLLDATERLTVPLRNLEGIDDVALNDLRQALVECRAAWRGEGAIPRVAVNVLVDLAGAIADTESSYEPDQGKQVIQVSREIAELIRATVALD